VHPMMIQAMAAERARETRADATAAGQARRLRRSRQTRSGGAFTAIGRAVRGPVSARAGQPLRPA
jgi:hypothetical protein